jgi:hypothetical protein
MGALSFMGQFVPMVELGLTNPTHPDAKRQSIRNFRRRPLKVGERLYLYFAQRSKWCKKLGEDSVKNVFIVHITDKRIRILDFRNDHQRNIINWKAVAEDPRRLKEFIKRLKVVKSITDQSELNTFAKADGFTDWETMKRWWKITHGTPLNFYGNLYKW